jgi:hypothetical protein
MHEFKCLMPAIECSLRANDSKSSYSDSSSNRRALCLAVQSQTYLGIYNGWHFAYCPITPETEVNDDLNNLHILNNIAEIFLPEKLRRKHSLGPNETRTYPGPPLALPGITITPCLFASHLTTSTSSEAPVGNFAPEINCSLSALYSICTKR